MASWGYQNDIKILPNKLAANGVVTKQSIQSFVARVAGAVLLIFSLAIGAIIAFAVWGLWNRIKLSGLDSVQSIQLGSVAVMVGFVFLALFCSTLGYRLAFNRPNRHKSILSPTAWIVLALSIGLIDFVIILFYLGKSKHLEMGDVVGSALSLAVSVTLIYGCLRARKEAILTGISEGTG